MDFLIRNMTKEDISRVGEILYEAFSQNASKHGYAPQVQSVQEGRAWAWAMLRHGPSERLVAEVESRVVGICYLNPRGDLAGAGPGAVDPCFQGKAVGWELLHAILKRAESMHSVRAIQEAYNPVTFSYQYSFNFMPVETLLDLFLDKGVEVRIDPRSPVSELTAADLDAISIYNGPRSKLDRRADFAYYLNWGKIFVYRYQSQIRGFLACLPGSKSVQLGPLLAEGEEEAVHLFRHALTIFGKRYCRARVMARDQSLAKALKELGFKLYCVDILMVRGSWRPSQYVEAFGIFPEGV
jgi:ribosomal protein S18 acetylase RimI-like enzyme